jgi:SAM-dependent methyltransferase
MEPVTDFCQLWHQLVVVHNRRREQTAGGGDVWQPKARRFQERVRGRWSRPDSSRDLIAHDLDAHPGSTLLDIGAGSGAWSIYLAPHAGRVTALEPSPAMLAAMRENLSREGVTNVAVVPGAWPCAGLPQHDVSLCSHAMYGATDFAGFVLALVKATRRRCYLVLRASNAGGVMADAARRVWGQPYDSPNFQVAYNALLQMGILANVQMEDSGLWQPWSHESLPAALAEVKRRLNLEDDDRHDAYLADLLKRRLTLKDGWHVWPREMRSALVYWDVV